MSYQKRNLSDVIHSIMLYYFEMNYLNQYLLVQSYLSIKLFDMMSLLSVYYVGVNHYLIIYHSDMSYQVLLSLDDYHYSYLYLFDMNYQKINCSDNHFHLWKYLSDMMNYQMLNYFEYQNRLYYFGMIGY